MNIRVTDDNIVIAGDFGAIDLDARNKIRDEIAQICRDRKSSRIIVDHRKSQLTMNWLDQYEFGRSFWDSGIPPASRITVLISDDHPNKDDILFSITVALNRGVLIQSCTGTMRDARRTLD